jgi:hypothetical protein
MKINMTPYTIPGLGALCAISVVSIAVAMRAPIKEDAAQAEETESAVSIPDRLVLEETIPTMEEVLAKHLFVPERHATGQKSFPDLVVKGVYVGGERNAVFSLKSKPQANLRIWQGDEEAALRSVVDAKDPRKPIADFLHDWQIKKVAFDGVTLEHIFTGEIETYAVDYTPAKHVKDSAAAGYGQGALVETENAQSVKSAAPQQPGAQQPQMRSPFSDPGAMASMASRMGEVMSRLSPEQQKEVFQRMKNAQDSQKNSQKSSQKSSSSGGSNGGSGKSGKSSKGKR